MPVPRHRDIRIGSPVSIVLKADQRTGRQVQGTVAQLLTRGDHPRGVKVRLADGRIGRVQQLASVPVQNSIATTTTQRLVSMNTDQNPWATSHSQGNPYISPQQQQQQQRQQSQQSQQGGGWGNPYNQQGQQGHAAEFYNQSPNQNTNQYTQQPSVPAQGMQGADTDSFLAQQSDRAEQIETMQNYEASARETKADRDQAQLQKEFPSVDSSLIAALYGDTQDLASTREMLQELARQ